MPYTIYVTTTAADDLLLPLNITIPSLLILDSDLLM
jgi:hypothetical protein